MKYKFIVLSVFMGIAIGSFCIGQGKPTVKSQAASDAEISDHDRIEKLLIEVAELQKKLAALEHKYDIHTHPLRNLEVAQTPGSIECDQTVVKWSSMGGNQEPVYGVCRQLGPNRIRGLVPSKGSMITGPPRP